MAMESLSLAGLRALVTGAGTGIGKQIALGFAEAGADLVFVGRRLEPLETVAAQAREKYGADVDKVLAEVDAKRFAKLNDANEKQAERNAQLLEEFGVDRNRFRTSECLSMVHVASG